MQFSSKKDLREKVLTLLRSQEEEKRIEKSLLLSNKLFEMKEYKSSSNILCYASFDGEVDTFDIIKNSLKIGKSVALPLINKGSLQISPRIIHSLESDLEIGQYGIKQPKIKSDNEMTQIDLVIVPGVVFDSKNNRIGRGAGYYDRFLSSLSQDTFTLGLAFDFQMVDSLPQIEKHDIPLKRVLTN